VIAALVRVAVEIEEQRFRRLAPDRIELLPIEAGVGIDVVRVQLQNFLPVGL